MEGVALLCITDLSSERHARMAERFARLNLGIQWTSAVRETPPGVNPRTSPIFLAHRRALEAFIETGLPHGVICEDDVHLSKDFPEALRWAVDAYQRHGLDVMLLGYLSTAPLLQVPLGFELFEKSRVLLSYPDDLWGAQMYLVGRRAAEALLRRFDPSDGSEIWNSDHNITKSGRRACIFPMLAVEEGDSQSTEDAQTSFHRDCHRANFSSAYNP